MKSKTIFLVIFSLVVIGLLIYGYFKAMPGVKDQTESQPRIEVSPQSFDFGDVEYGDIAEHIFKVKNLGNEILEIRKIATSCACTTAQIEKEKLDPGEETNLLVRYDTGAMSGFHAKGNQERIIYIRSNDSLNPQIEVMIYAYVR